MAGYLMVLDSIDSLGRCAEKGVYSTKLSKPGGSWGRHHEATFADYATMNPGDNIYFFIQRKIYGIGELVELGPDCKFQNYPEASTPNDYEYTHIKESLLWDEGPASEDQRWICTFKPSPFFFKQGIDMDRVLLSDPEAFRMIRFFWKRSFMKLGDEENQALKDIVLKTNMEYLKAPIPDVSVFKDDSTNIHKAIVKKLATGSYLLDIEPILDACATGAELAHEMAIEAAILNQLTLREDETRDTLGNWDYLSHQVHASPFKPPDYADKMDIFGYSYIPGHKPSIGKYLVIEIKKGAAAKADVDQLMKYVDWVKDEYSKGDYGPIQAALITQFFSQSVIGHKEEMAKRLYTIGIKPAESKVWEDVKLLEYSYDSSDHIVRMRER